MRPVLVKAEARPDGRLTLTYAVAPGRRITMTAGFEVLTEDLAAAIVDRIIPIIEANRRDPGRKSSA